jgi:hypothetical protein
MCLNHSHLNKYIFQCPALKKIQFYGIPTLKWGDLRAMVLVEYSHPGKKMAGEFNYEA